MKLQRLAYLLPATLLLVSCDVIQTVHNGRENAPCAFTRSMDLVAVKAKGIQLSLPSDAGRPRYDSDDFQGSRPIWIGANWKVDFVYGNGGLTSYVGDAHCCSIDDRVMIRHVCIGHYMDYGAMVDLARVTSPKQITSAQVTMAPQGVSQDEALSIIASMVTTWETP
jgi:hypothetical protein